LAEERELHQRDDRVRGTESPDEAACQESDADAGPQRQLSAALAFLNAHPHPVHVITISLTDLAGNALSNLYFGVCAQDPTCTQNAFPAFLAHEATNADEILSALFDPYMAAIPASTL
jgi:hypothetical protein